MSKWSYLPCLYKYFSEKCLIYKNVSSIKCTVLMKKMLNMKSPFHELHHTKKKILKPWSWSVMYTVALFLGYILSINWLIVEDINITCFLVKGIINFLQFTYRDRAGLELSTRYLIIPPPTYISWKCSIKKYHKWITKVGNNIFFCLKI